MPSAMLVNATNPRVAAHFVRRLIVVLHISSIVWLYNDESRPIIGSLIAAANRTQCQAHYLHGSSYPAFIELLNGLRIGPHYAVIYVVSNWQSLGKSLSSVRAAMRTAFLCRHFVMFVDGRAPHEFGQWIVPDVAELIASVRFTTDAAIVQQRSEFGDLVDFRATTTAEDFFANRSRLALMSHDLAPVYTGGKLRVTMTDCMNLMTDTAVLFGRDVAMYRLLAERTRTRLEITCSESFVLSWRHRSFNRQTFRLNVMGEQPRWLRTFVARKEMVYRSSGLIHLQKGIQSGADRPHLTTKPFRYSHYAIVVPYDLVERPKSTADTNGVLLLGVWLLTLAVIGMLRRVTAANTIGWSELFVDTVGRALSVSVADSSSDRRRRLSVHLLLADVTLFGMLAGSMCAGIFYERYTEPNVRVQRIQTVAELCASELMVGFVPWTPAAVVDRWKFLCPRKTHQIQMSIIDIGSEEAYVLPYEELNMLATSKLLRQPNGAPMLYILKEKLINHNYVLIVPLANLGYIVDRLLLRFAAAGLLQHFDTMAEFVCRLLDDGRTTRTEGAASAVVVQHYSQWLDLKWLWVAYLVGNCMAIGLFAAGVLLDLKTFKTKNEPI